MIDTAVNIPSMMLAAFWDHTLPSELESRRWFLPVGKL